MNFLTAVVANVVKWLLEKLGVAVMKWLALQNQIKKKVTKNEKAIEQVKEAETPEEFDDAARAIGERSDKSE